jgi:hypothetical protein
MGQVPCPAVNAFLIGKVCQNLAAAIAVLPADLKVRARVLKT